MNLLGHNTNNLFSYIKGSQVEKPPYKKSSIYFKNDEFIVALRVTGQKYLHYIEIETNLGNVLKSGFHQKNDHVC